MSETINLSKGVPFVVDELTEEEEKKFYAECGKRTLQIAKEYWLSACFTKTKKERDLYGSAN